MSIPNAAAARAYEREQAMNDWLDDNCHRCLLRPDCHSSLEYRTHGDILADYFTSFAYDWTLPLASAPCTLKVMKAGERDEM